eukprot:1159963-Pelagomonas_calceolata.AAC.5
MSSAYTRMQQKHRMSLRQLAWEVLVPVSRQPQRAVPAAIFVSFCPEDRVCSPCGQCIRLLRLRDKRE